MSRDKAFHFLCGCLSLDDSPTLHDALCRAAESQEFAWETLVALASEHWVTSAVSAAVRHKQIAEVLPRDLLDYFDGMASLNRQRNAQAQTEIVEIARLLNKIGVMPVLLKGAANLLSDLYRDRADRIMSDVDLLVPNARLMECVAVLHDNGYHRVSDLDHLQHHHYAPLARSDSPISIELHVKPLTKPFCSVLLASQCFEAAAMLALPDIHLGVPSPFCRVVHAIAHAELSDRGYLYGRLKLRDLLDVALLVDRFGAEIDTGAVAQRFSENGYATAFAFVAIAAERLLGASALRQGRRGPLAHLLYQRAEWQVGHPRLMRLSSSLLRPWITVIFSLSHVELRRRLLRNLCRAPWWRRQWQMLGRE